MPDTLEAPPTPTAAPKPSKGASADDTAIAKTKRAEVEAAKAHRRTFSAEWKRNIDLRLGKPGISGVADEGGGDLQSEVNPDWSLTKTKTANLYSQVPQVQGTHENTQYAVAIAPFMKSLNYELGEKRANIGVAMEEVLNDVVNAAGIGALVVSYEARFRSKDVPVDDMSQLPPEVVQAGIDQGLIKTQPVQQAVDYRFSARRISPSDLLWPKSFMGSNFDDAPWVGHTGRTTWSVAKDEFKLSDAQKEKATSGGDRNSEDDLRNRTDRESDDDIVTFDQVFYWRYLVDASCPSFKEIWRLVFVHGLEEEAKPAIHEPWKGQQYDDTTGKYVGACKFPIRVLTLTYVTDNPVPPSDTAAGRPQVNDLRRSRSQMFQNRERSRPVRWYDVNRIDPLIAEQLNKGTWQGFIPSLGDGTRSIGEIARASYPSEDLTFDASTKADLMETWQIGPNQAGTVSSGDKTKAEVQTVQSNFATRIGQERARVAYCFVTAAEVLAGLMALYSDYPILTEQEKGAMLQAWDPKHILHDLVLKIRPDSQVMLDVSSQLQRIEKLISLTAKSGLVNLMPVITEYVALSGFDPAVVMSPPKPKEPEQPSISFGFKGKDDIINPAVMAMLVHTKQAPTAEDIQAAKTLLKSIMPEDPQQVAPEDGGGPPQADGAVPPPHAGVMPEPGEDMAPQWGLANRVSKRSRDISGG